MRVNKYRKNIFIALICLIAYLFIFHIKFTWHYKASELIQKSSLTTRKIWDFVADINHLYISNPSVRGLSILWDRADRENWHYGALIKYHHPDIGLWSITAEFHVLRADPLLITASHSFCVLHFICGSLESQLRFTDSGTDSTKVEEQLELALPWVLDSYYGHQRMLELLSVRLDRIKTHLQATY